MRWTRVSTQRASMLSLTYLFTASGIPHHSSSTPPATVSHPPQPGYLGPLGPSTDLNRVETRAEENNPGAGELNVVIYVLHSWLAREQL